MHTESVNIHTHMWGAAAVLVGIFPVYQSISTRYPSFTAHDTIAFGIWAFCAFLCLGLSATYHAICNHSPEVNSITQKFDHFDIIVMTCGSFLSMIYYGWYCEPTLAYTFAIMVCVSRNFVETCHTCSLDSHFVSRLRDHFCKPKNTNSGVETLSRWYVHLLRAFSPDSDHIGYPRSWN